jgi:predicted Zn-dependent protease
MMMDRTETSNNPATEAAVTPYPLVVRVLTVGLLLVLATACAAGPREESLRTLVTEEEERAQTTELERRAARFRWNQQVRLERVLMRLLLAVPDPPQLSVEVGGCDGVNAYVGKRKIHVCLGMLRFVKSDDELAVVLGHEMGHLPTSAEQGLVGGSRREEERAADIRGLLYAHRAGYDIRAGAKVFERMAVELSPSRWDTKPTGHPSHAERVVLAAKISLLLDRGGAESDLEAWVNRLHRLVGSFDDLP